MINIPKDIDLRVKNLGETKHTSPLAKFDTIDLGNDYFVRDDKNKIIVNPHEDEVEGKTKNLCFERAGAREKQFFSPANTKAAIVTCGGLCPGLNDVIRGLVMEMYHWYGIDDIYGVRYGYNGLSANPEYPLEKLTPDMVSEIHKQGGTILGTSRGHPDTREIVDTLVKKEINILFCIGGDGTLTGAHAIAEEIERQELNISIIGIPKTIDNDIPFVYQSFGFQTAIAEAAKVLDCAHTEAVGAQNGVGLVKLMGRDAGFITSHATRASGNVNFCLIPEMNFYTEGPNGLYNRLRERLRSREHAVIAVAEGAGQEIIGDTGETDASGNKIFKDIGRYLRSDMKEYFKKQWDMDLNVKYISPSYVIRSVSANSQDSIFCADLARYAVMAALAGKTDLLIGHWHGEFTHVPLTAIEGIKKRVVKNERLWLSVMATTGQPMDWW